MKRLAVSKAAKKGLIVIRLEKTLKMIQLITPSWAPTLPRFMIMCAGTSNLKWIALMKS